MRVSHCALILLAVVAILPAKTLAQSERNHTHAVSEKFGRVHFPTSCRPEVQPTFTHGVALLHSFAYVEASRTFAEVATKDPDCAMAQWGIAMSQFHAIWAPPTEDEFAAGRTAARKAATMATPIPRERDYIAAIGAFYEGDGLPYPARIAAFEQGMARVEKRNPEDREAEIFHALAILSVAYNSPPDKTYARQKQAAEILNRLLPLAPEHPGVAHYMIHSFDYPEIAQLALPAARAYAKIAPSAPHAQHMPSHIFTRLGMWHESIASNLSSAETAQAWIATTHPGATAFDALHAMDYLEYAYLQTGQDDKARKVAEDAAGVTSLDIPSFQAGYALAAIRARYAIERRAWKEAAALSVQPAAYPWDKYPYAEANIHFARAVGAARAGDTVVARAAVAKLTSLEAMLRGRKGFDWATQVEIQRRAAEGWLARAEHRDDEAVVLMRSAADLEDSTDKHPVTPGAILPAREQLADLLAELGKPSAALAEYEASLRSAPARFNSYLGAARAAESAGLGRKAKTYHDQLVALCGGSLPARMTMAKATAD